MTTFEKAAVERPPAMFARQATGLVRESRTNDALYYNVMWSSVALTFAFYVLYVLGAILLPIIVGFTQSRGGFLANLELA